MDKILNLWINWKSENVWIIKKYGFKTALERFVTSKADLINTLDLSGKYKNIFPSCFEVGFGA